MDKKPSKSKSKNKEDPSSSSGGSDTVQQKEIDNAIQERVPSTSSTSTSSTSSTPSSSSLSARFYSGIVSSIDKVAILCTLIILIGVGTEILFPTSYIAR